MVEIRLGDAHRAGRGLDLVRIPCLGASLTADRELAAGVGGAECLQRRPGCRKVIGVLDRELGRSASELPGDTRCAPVIFLHGQ